MKKGIIIFLIVASFVKCTSPYKENNDNGVIIEFGKAEKANTSLLADMDFVKLETIEHCLIDEILQIEVFDKQIYILDRFALYVFGLDGKFIKKLQGSGNGPGEFMSPSSFWIDKNGYVLIADMLSVRLLKYGIESFEFIENIIMPNIVPMGFGIVPETDMFIYYFPKYSTDIDIKQVFIANKKGDIQTELLEAMPSGRIVHGNNDNFYLMNNEIRFYPYFSNTVYTVSSDSLHIKYRLFFGGYTFPNQDFFARYEKSSDVMNELLNGNNNWIRYVILYETDKDLIVRYFIKRDHYISFYSKESGKTIHFKEEDVIDDIGIGGKFPVPVGVYENRIIGEIQPYDFDKQQVKNNQLKEFTEGLSEEDNPILVFYKMNF